MIRAVVAALSTDPTSAVGHLTNITGWFGRNAFNKLRTGRTCLVVVIAGDLNCMEEGHIDLPVSTRA